MVLFFERQVQIGSNSRYDAEFMAVFTLLGFLSQLCN